jgi:hypothetical protein
MAAEEPAGTLAQRQSRRDDIYVLDQRTKSAESALDRLAG